MRQAIPEPRAETFQPARDVLVASATPEPDHKRGPTKPVKARESDRQSRRMKRAARNARLPLRVWARKHASDQYVARWLAGKGL